MSQTMTNEFVVKDPQRAATIRVFLVDDHAIVRRGLASLINAEPDMEVCGEADSVDSAMHAIEQTRPRIALVDLSLKEGDGLDLLKLLARDCPQTITLVLSMYDERVYAERALRAGARGYVRKMDVSETVIVAIRRVLAGEIYVSSDVTTGLLHRLAGSDRARTTSPVSRLSDRELQVLRAIGRGLSNREIADELFISPKTVESHREHLKQKLELDSSGDLLRFAIEFTRLEA